MKLVLPENSLFAILLRSRWWVSLLVALGAFAVVRLFLHEGYSVKRVEGAADFELERAGRLSLVAAKRWKASSTGVDPLKELVAAGEAREAVECVYVLAGEMTQNAMGFAKKTKISWVRGADLVKLVGERNS